MKEQFVQLFADGKSIQDCILALQINRTTYEYHLRQDRAFKAMLEASKSVHCDDLEHVMLTTARTPKGYADRQTYLKAYRPEVFDRKQESTPVNITISLDAKAMEEAELRAKSIDTEGV